MSAFSVPAPVFDAFLVSAKDSLALLPDWKGDPRNARFIPRNFLIEEHLDDARAASYAGKIPPAGPGAFTGWNESHNLNLKEKVFVTPTDVYGYASVSTEDPLVCPETFHNPVALVGFESTDLDTYLIRVVAVDSLQYLSGEREDRIFTLGQQVLAEGQADGSAGDELGAILQEAFLGSKCDHRPVFAAFYEDYLDELKVPDDSSWPNRLRNRLGLYHLNQWLGPLPRRVFLFRYRVREIPSRQGQADRRPIAFPSVLDLKFSEAFCPAPRESLHSQVVNLEANANTEPAREVLHLFMPLEPRHLFRVGSITQPVSADLGPARKDHLQRPVRGTT